MNMIPEHAIVVEEGPDARLRRRNLPDPIRIRTEERVAALKTKIDQAKEHLAQFTPELP